VSKEIFFEALGRAKKGRIHILDLISQTISGPRTDVSEFAPKIVTIKINPDKIGGIIGSGGKTIKAIQEETDSTITIAEDGLVKIFGYDKEKLNSAKAYVKLIAFGPRNGEIYTGPVMRIEKYGVFVELAPGVKGLLHVSQFEEKGYPEKLFKMGQQITAKIKYVNSREGKIDLTQKDMNGEKRPDQG
ncbi:S1 RNA-binding domain-containing protein, partial [Candidatus Calescamantes bacterium]|nr:S1 RNA-binding domain-containing protein [Candidatus Calescamantes bacterium]